MQGDSVLLDQVVDTGGVGDGCAADNAMNLVALLQKELCQIGAILTGDTSDEFLFHVFYSSLRNDLSFDVLSIFYRIIIFYGFWQLT